jgi:hypothetical protein
MFYINSFLRLYIYISKKHKTKGERKMTATMTMASVEKFQSAEQLWFWFLYSKSVRNNFCRNHNTPTKRPCEILYVETMITKLYLAGRLSDEQLAVMKKFGDKRRAPHMHIWSENKAAAQ